MEKFLVFLLFGLTTASPYYQISYRPQRVDQQRRYYNPLRGWTSDVQDNSRDYSDESIDQQSTGTQFYRSYFEPRLVNNPNPIFPTGPRINHDKSFQHFKTLFNRHLGKHFPGYAKVPTFDLNSLPENYHNKTHHVHIGDDHHVTVNQTVHKKAEDGYRSVFHKKVVYIRPHGGKSPITTEATIATFTPTEYTVTSEVATTESSNRGDVPDPSNEPLVPDTHPSKNNRHKFDLMREIQVPELQVDDKFDYTPSFFHDQQKYNHKLRSLKTPSEMLAQTNKDIMLNDAPHASPYIDYNDIDIFEGTPPKDLSSDTNINRIHASDDGTHEGMILAEPESEIFDLPKVIDSLKPLEDD